MAEVVASPATAQTPATPGPPTGAVVAGGSSISGAAGSIRAGIAGVGAAGADHRADLGGEADLRSASPARGSALAPCVETRGGHLRREGRQVRQCRLGQSDAAPEVGQAGYGTAQAEPR